MGMKRGAHLPKSFHSIEFLFHFVFALDMFKLLIPLDRSLLLQFNDRDNYFLSKTENQVEPIPRELWRKFTYADDWNVFVMLFPLLFHE